MKALICLALSALVLGACATAPTPTVNTKTELVPVSVDHDLFGLDLCPTWPRKADFIVAGTDEEGLSYLTAGYLAYRCEREARISAGERQREIELQITRDGAARR